MNQPDLFAEPPAYESGVFELSVGHAEPQHVKVTPLELAANAIRDELARNPETRKIAKFTLVETKRMDALLATLAPAIPLEKTDV